jgi:hypothetical protein
VELAVDGVDIPLVVEVPHQPAQVVQAFRVNLDAAMEVAEEQVGLAQEAMVVLAVCLVAVAEDQDWELVTAEAQAGEAK